MGIFNAITNAVYGKNAKEEKPKIARKNAKKVAKKDGVEQVIVRHEERAEHQQLIDENERLHQMQAKRRNS